MRRTMVWLAAAWLCTGTVALVGCDMGDTDIPSEAEVDGETDGQIGANAAEEAGVPEVDRSGDGIQRTGPAEPGVAHMGGTAGTSAVAAPNLAPPPATMPAIPNVTGSNSVASPRTNTGPVQSQ